GLLRLRHDLRTPAEDALCAHQRRRPARKPRARRHDHPRGSKLCDRIRICVPIRESGCPVLRAFCEGWGFCECGYSTRLSSDRHHVLKAWIAAILWLIVIAIESTTYLSSHNTSRILYPLLHFLFGMDLARFEHWHFYIRKGGHVFGYGMLSILLFRAWRETLPVVSGARWTLRWTTLAVLGTALVASLDEWHQSF